MNLDSAVLMLSHLPIKHIRTHESVPFILNPSQHKFIQQIGKQAAAVIHSKDLFHAPDREFPWPEVGRAFSIHYSRSHAVAREIREKLREHGLIR